MPIMLLDTDILSEVLKQKHPIVGRKAVAYLAAHRQFTFSSMTRYEVVRGLKEKAAPRQLQQFATFCGHSVILPISESILDRAAHLWVTARQAGTPKKDADLIIAATALEHGLGIVTGNAIDFSWIAGLTLEDWRLP